jgi:hypothetical protein
VKVPLLVLLSALQAKGRLEPKQMTPLQKSAPQHPRPSLVWWVLWKLLTTQQQPTDKVMLQLHSLLLPPAVRKLMLVHKLIKPVSIATTMLLWGQNGR